MSEPFFYGGQAVIEGVMMRGRQAMAVAVRHPSGQVVVHSEPLTARPYRHPWTKRPFIRGVLLLWDTLVLGTRALMYSANVAMQESPESRVPSPESEGAARDAGSGERDAEQGEMDLGGGALWGTMAMSLTLGIGIFFVSPLLLTRTVDHLLPSAVLSVAVEGLIRIGLFFGYVWLIGRLPDIRRVFAYHGAEHKTINAFEAGEPLHPDHVERYSVAHPRCGTSFLLVVVVLSIFVFALLGRPSLPVRIVSRIALVPVIAAVGYELIRAAAKRRQHAVVRLLMAPGMALQALTTREPDRSQVEVAIEALKRVLELDGVSARAPAPAAATAPP
jgi:uncharacterized protein YqhQ